MRDVRVHMEASTIGTFVTLKALIVFGAFVVILYFAVLLYRAKVSGSRFLLAGGIAILVGRLIGTAIFDFGTVALWLSLALETIGAIFAAYGFARVTGATIKYLGSR
jgi:hypothetical protein